MRSEQDIECDDDGVELPDAVMAQGAAEGTAHKLRDGLLYRVDSEKPWSIVIADDAGEVLHIVLF
jgi:hypothetical protein